MILHSTYVLHGPEFDSVLEDLNYQICPYTWEVVQMAGLHHANPILRFRKLAQARIGSEFEYCFQIGT